MTPVTWRCRWCAEEHLHTTAGCPVLALDGERFVRTSRWMRPTKAEVERWAQARADMAVEAVARAAIGNEEMNR